VSKHQHNPSLRRFETAIEPRLDSRGSQSGTIAPMVTSEDLAPNGATRCESR
jgi:hypothetical protein